MQAHLPRALRAFGLNVRKRREASGFDAGARRQKANLDPIYISGIERGVRNPIRIWTLFYDVTHSPWIETPHSDEVYGCQFDIISFSHFIRSAKTGEAHVFGWSLVASIR